MCFGDSQPSARDDFRILARDFDNFSKDLSDIEGICSILKEFEQSYYAFGILGRLSLEHCRKPPLHEVASIVYLCELSLRVNICVIEWEGVDTHQIEAFFLQVLLLFG